MFIIINGYNNNKQRYLISTPAHTWHVQAALMPAPFTISHPTHFPLLQNDRLQRELEEQKAERDHATKTRVSPWSVEIPSAEQRTDAKKKAFTAYQVTCCTHSDARTHTHAYSKTSRNYSFVFELRNLFFSRGNVQVDIICSVTQLVYTKYMR